jgi:lipoprotein-anchoring transpeptidase ErfK/SrfK
LLIVTVLAALAYGVFAWLTTEPMPESPVEVPEDWATGPPVEMPSMPDLGPTSYGGAYPEDTGGEAPKFVLPSDGGQAPPVSLPSDMRNTPRNEGESAPVGLPVTSNGLPPVNVGLPLPGAENPQVPGVHQPVSTAVAPPYAQEIELPRQPTEGPETEQGAQYTSPAAVEQAIAQARDEFAAEWSTILSQLDQGNQVQAHLMLSKWFDDPALPQQQRAEISRMLDDLAGHVIYSREHHLEPPYEVQPGDSLQSIGQAYNVPWKLLAKINGISDPAKLRAGDQLKVMHGPFVALVELSKYRLTLWLDGRYCGSFPIGIGLDNSTPVGDFEAIEKIENPTYYGPEGEVVDKDDPANPLGEYWISLGNQIGIHGTNDPASIGRSVSRGCIRLGQRDVQDVYDILTPGSKVIIRR